MLRFLLNHLFSLPLPHFRSWLLRASARRSHSIKRSIQRSIVWLSLMGFTSLSLGTAAPFVKAQVTQNSQILSAQTIALPQQFAVLPNEDSGEDSGVTVAQIPTSTPEAETTPEPRPPRLERTPPRKSAQPLSEYVMEFNRSPVVGNRLRLQGVYPQTRLGFTRPRNWDVETTKIVLRYQHSPTLLPEKSRLVVRVNDRSVGSIPLDRQNSQIGEAEFTVPKSLVQDYNEISMLAEQRTAETCANPSDPMLWTEILPDSQVVIGYRTQPVQLNLSSYPFPFLDKLSLEPNQVNYLQPKTYSSDWLTATARFQTAAARSVDYRALKTQIIQDPTSLKRDDRLIVIGTPIEQAILSDLSLPLTLKNNQWLDAKRQPIPEDVGVLMLTTLQDQGTPVLIATGNSPAAVQRAVQLLVQNRDRQLASGQALLVDQLTEVAAPEARDWPGYLPAQDQFQLKDLAMPNHEPFQEVTVRGTNAPPISIPFQALPDDRFLRGSKMTLHYTHSPQVNSRTSAIEVKLDGVTLGSKRLDGNQSDNQTLRLNIPDNLVKPDSTLSVNFVMYPREMAVCGLETDQQLWGTLHADTSFKLMRDTVVTLPDLKLLRSGFPFTAPQDLSAMAVVLPQNPTNTEVETLLALSERLGRISQANSVNYQVYLGDTPTEARLQHIVGIGTRDRFPITAAFQDQGFNLAESLTRFWGNSRVQAFPDQEGVLKETLSPWNRDHVLLTLTAQTDAGLEEVQSLLHQDSLFTQLQGDTVLISRNRANPSPYDASGYTLNFLQDTPTKQMQRNSSFNQLLLFLQDHWFFLLAGMLLLPLLLYSLSQIFLDRVADGDAS